MVRGSRGLLSVLFLQLGAVMRSLVILGGLVVCVLLVTESNGDPTKDGGREPETMDSERRKLMRHDNYKPPCCPPRGKKPRNCKGRCHSLHMVRSVAGLSAAAEDQDGISDLSKFWGHIEDGGTDGIAVGSPSGPDKKALVRPRRQEPTDTSKPRRRKPCIGCYTSMVVPKLDSKTRRMRKHTERHPKSGRMEESRARKRNGRKRQDKKEEEEGKINRRFGARSAINASPPGKKYRMQKEAGGTRGRHHHRHEGKRKGEKTKWRSGARTAVGSTPDGGKKEWMEDARPDA